MWSRVGCGLRTCAGPARLARASSRPLSSSAVRPPYKVLLMGADAFSCATLEALHDARDGLIDELLVLTPPNKYTGRGLKTVHTPALKTLAHKLGYDTQPVPEAGLKNWQLPPSFATATPSPSSILLTASFGYMIPSSLLSQFLPLNTLNVHPSLLPRYRGASPIQYTIINGDREMGVSVQELSKGKFDRGRLLGQKRMPTPPNPTFATLEPILAAEGAALLVSVLQNLAEAQANATEQDPALVTLAPKLHKDMAHVDWAAQTADELLRLQAGIAHQFPLQSSLLPLDPAQAPVAVQLELAPLPASFAALVAAAPEPALPGMLTFDRPSKKLVVSCRDGGALEVVRVKSAGSKRAPGREWWNGVGGKGGIRRLV